MKLHNFRYLKIVVCGLQVYTGRHLQPQKRITFLKNPNPTLMPGAHDREPVLAMHLPWAHSREPVLAMHLPWAGVWLWIVALYIDDVGFQILKVRILDPSKRA